MSHRSRVLTALLALALGAGAVSVWLLPERGIVALRRALTAGDEAAMNERVDFEALQEHLKHQLLESFTRAAPDEQIAMAASRFVGPLVDGLVTPASLARLASSGAVSQRDARTRWRSLDTAEALLRDEDGRESRWLLERRGWRFVLVGIELPREMTIELERQWAERLAARGPPSADDEAQLHESGARACAAWRKNALGVLQALTLAQRAHHAAHGRYSDELSALDVGPARGPELYDFVIRHADEGRFTLEARGKALMAGDVLEANERGIRVVRDLCTRATQ